MMGDNGEGEQGKNTPNLPPVETRWKPGQSGNPNGRPNGAKDGVVACLRRELKKRAPADVLKRLDEFGLKLRGKTNAHAVAAVLTMLSLKGSDKAIRTLLEYTEPKPAQALALTGKDGGPVEVAVEDARAKFATLVDQLRTGASQGGDSGPEPK